MRRRGISCSGGRGGFFLLMVLAALVVTVGADDAGGGFGMVGFSASLYSLSAAKQKQEKMLNLPMSTSRPDERGVPRRRPRENASCSLLMFWWYEIDQLRQAGGYKRQQGNGQAPRSIVSMSCLDSDSNVARSLHELNFLDPRSIPCNMESRSPPPSLAARSRHPLFSS